METKISGLTASNVRALRETFPDSLAEGNLKLTATTATWSVPAHAALTALDGAMSLMPSKGHPRASLYAVVRKLVKAMEAETPSTTEEVEEEQEEKQYDRHRQNIRKVLAMGPDELPRGGGPRPDLMRRDREDAAQARREQSAAYKAEQRERTQTMADEQKAAKQTARDQGVPDVYLGEGGNFLPGKDARYKSDLIKSVLGLEDDAMAHKFEAADAEERLQVRGWTGFLTAKREAIAKKAAKVEAKAAEKPAKPARSSRKKAAEKAEVTPDPKPSKKPARRGGRIRK